MQVIRSTLHLLPPDTPPLRIGFVSDLHLGPTTADITVSTAFGHLKDARPDVVLLGGDYVLLSAGAEKMDRLRRFIDSLGSQYLYGVLGNHDLWTDYHAIIETLERAGVTVLRNASLRLPEPWSNVELAGIDDPYSGLPRSVGSGDSGTLVTLCHSPDGLLHTNPASKLFLAGHTHGGQIAAPWGPLIVPAGELSRRHNAGFYEVNGTTVFVSKGVGGADLPVRLFAPPDVAILDLVPSQ